MKVRFFSVLAAAMLVAGGAAWSAAASSHSVGVTLLEATTVSGTVLPAGHYHFSWMGDSNQVNVTIKKGSNVVAETPAKLEQRSDQAPWQEVITRTVKSGAHVLEQLRLGGKKTALVFAPVAS